MNEWMKERFWIYDFDNDDGGDIFIWKKNEIFFENSMKKETWILLE